MNKYGKQNSWMVLGAVLVLVLGIAFVANQQAVPGSVTQPAGQGSQQQGGAVQIGPTTDPSISLTLQGKDSRRWDTDELFVRLFTGAEEKRSATSSSGVATFAAGT